MALIVDWMDILDWDPVANPIPSALVAPQFSAARYYYCPELPRAPLPLEFVCAGWENCRLNYGLVRRSFNWFGVELIARR